MAWICPRSGLMYWVTITTIKMSEKQMVSITSGGPRFGGLQGVKMLGKCNESAGEGF